MPTPSSSISKEMPSGYMEASIPYIRISNGIDSRLFTPNGSDTIPDGYSITMILGNKITPVDVFDSSTHKIIAEFVSNTMFCNRIGILNPNELKKTLLSGKSYRGMYLRHSSIKKPNK
jgi:hypothetical protein